MITVKVDPQVWKRFEQTIKDYIAISDKPIETVIRDQARLLCKDLAGQTDRLGLNKSIYNKHAKDIARNVFSIYSVNIPEKLEKIIRGKGGEKAAQRFKQYLISEDINKINGMLKDMFGKEMAFERFDGGKAHSRWKTRTRSKQYVLLAGDPQANRGKIKRYIRKEIKKIGNAKAGWARAAESIGGAKNPTTGIPGWAKRKSHKTRGYGKITGTGAKTIAEIGSSTKYGINRHGMNQALRWRMDAIRLQMNKIVRINARHVNKAQRQGRNISKLLTQ